MARSNAPAAAKQGTGIAAAPEIIMSIGWLLPALLWLIGIDLRLPLLAVPPLLPAIHRDLHLNHLGLMRLRGLVQQVVDPLVRRQRREVFLLGPRIGLLRLTEPLVEPVKLGSGAGGLLSGLPGLVRETLEAPLAAAYLLRGCLSFAIGFRVSIVSGGVLRFAIPLATGFLGAVGPGLFALIFAKVFLLKIEVFVFSWHFRLLVIHDGDRAWTR